MARRTVAILGGGLLAQAVARVVRGEEIAVRIWARRAEARAELAELTGAEVASSATEAAEGADVVVLAVPAGGLREVAALYGEVARGDQVVLHGVRGICAGPDATGFALPHQVIRQECCVRKIGVIGGPLVKPDLVSGRPLALVVASRFNETFARVGELAAGKNLHVSTTHDVVGVEVAGAVSNVSAIAAGMADALDLGETARGVLLTRGLGEASRLGLELGAEVGTFAGLAGVGDLIPRRVTSTERHHALGAQLAKGVPLDEAIGAAAGEIEGVASAARIRTLAQNLRLSLPLIEAVDDVCQGRRPAADAIDDVLRRQLDLVAGAM